MDVSVNYLAVILGAVASMAAGSIWYAPSVFGKTWQKLIGLTDKDLSKDWVPAMVKASLMSLITAYILFHITFLSNSYFNNSWMSASLSTAFWAWLGFVVTSHITNDSFERRNFKLTALGLGHHLIEFLAIAIVIGLIGK